MSLLEQLNAPQREAVTTTEGPLLVLAGAGSGKTRVLTYRIAHILEQGLATANEILAVTFTNKAAGEMRERVGALCGARKFPYLGTFHACCVRMIRTHAQTIGLPAGFSIYDTADQLNVVKEASKERGISEDVMPPRRALSMISNAKNRLETPEMFARSAATPELEAVAKIYQSYQTQLEHNFALDFDDILMRSVRMLDEHPDILAQYQERFKYILVDEYQDVNFAQYVLIRKLAAKHGNLCVVGDDDQSIYGFRGADVSIILQFEKDFPNAKVIKLEQNYRSTKAVLDAANAVVANNPNRKPKTMWTANAGGNLPLLFEAPDARSEARYVVRKIKDLALNGREYGEFAILYRTNAQSRVFEESLRILGIPYILVGGTRFWERKEIKDLLAYARLVVNPDDNLSLRRIINVPPRGIGSVTLQRLEQAADKLQLSLYGLLMQIEKVGDLTPKILAAVSEVRSLIEGLQRKRDMALREVFDRIIRTTGYKTYVSEDKSGDAESRLENINELLNSAAEFEKAAIESGEEPTLENFLSQASLTSDQDTLEGKGGMVTLLTLHSAKGLEFPVVFLGGLEEELFPHKRVQDNPQELEEERRLCYVGMTRAREVLYLTRAQYRDMYGGEPLPRFPSRFLSEIPEQMIERDEPDPAMFEDERPRYRTYDEDSYTPAYGSGYTGGYNSGGYNSRSSSGPPPRSGGLNRGGTDPRRNSPVRTITSRGGSSSSSSRGSSSSRSSPARTVMQSYTTPPKSFTPTSASSRLKGGEGGPAPGLFKPGEQVVHKVFGTGNVTKVDGKTVTAEFPGYGEKTVVDTFLKAAPKGDAATRE